MFVLDVQWSVISARLEPKRLESFSRWLMARPTFGSRTRGKRAVPGDNKRA
jgi:hypothetical protein